VAELVALVALAAALLGVTPATAPSDDLLSISLPCRLLVAPLSQPALPKVLLVLARDSKPLQRL